ncbi:uncharacterized protein LOC133843571 [Drosophila sulfurigaster albostrigata]|uniref:uncharacterized protein LOC133843571 n=1 Tax=Drosophila sulfurigaster albostrigata TaxID=89887 RepID=UPI002D219A99|nr:uncharacterized protein LOC133843571 [Drosophila sulfurigaster albostrigata]
MLLKSLLLLGCVALIHGAALQEQEEAAETIVNILNEEQMAKFLAENPDAIKLNREVSIQGRADYTVYKLTWTLGARKSGDTNVYNGYSDYIWFEQASNPQIIVTYPKEGTGKVVTHVSIETKQSSTSGEAYISAGGIGQRTIQFYVRGYNTIFYAWDINIYGQ